MSEFTVNHSNAASSVPRVLAITGGKGGVGKTSLAVNLAIALSRNGNKVCLFDADTGLANINVMLGLHPAYTLEHLFTGEKSIQDIVIEGPEGIQIVPGASGFAQCVELDVGQQQRLVSSLQSVEPHYDYMLVDTAAGISPTVLHFIAASQIAALVVTPEPTSLTDAFSLLKVLKRRGYRRKVQVIVNMSANSSQAEKVFRRFSHAVDKYLQLKTEYLGSVWMDESMRTAVTLQRPVALFPKHDPSARSFYRLAERIDDVFSRRGAPKLAFSAYWQKLLEAHASRKQKQFVEGRSLGKGLTAVSEKPQDAPHNVSVPQVYSKVVDIRGQDYQAQTVPQPETGQGPTQVERQLEQKQREVQLRELAQNASEPEALDAEDTAPLDDRSENNWIDLRMQLSQFSSDPNTTPEQITTILSSLVFGFGERLGAASIDIVQGMLTMLKPEDLSDENRLMLHSELLRLGVVEVPVDSEVQEEIIEVEGKDLGERYDARGFGSQQNLAQAIRSSSEKIPLESLLESIKYASLVDNSKD